MGRFSSIKNNFRSGEVSPKNQGKTDLGELYNHGLGRCKNAIPTSIGGLARRPGSVYVDDVTVLGIAGSGLQSFALDGTDKARIIPFEFDGAESYLYIICGKKGGRSSVIDLTLAQAKAFTVFQKSHVVNVGRPTVAIGYGVPSYRGSSSTYSAFLDDINSDSGTSFAVGVYTNPENTPYYHAAGINTEYEASELKEVQYLQINDLLFLVHKNHPPLILQRTTNNNFIERSYRELAAIPSTAAFSGTAAEEWMAQWYLGVPYRDPVIVPGAQPLFRISSTGNAGTIATVTISNALSWGGFIAATVGKVFIATHGSTTGACVVTRGTSATQARVMILKAFGAADTDTSNWRESAWSDVHGWPSTIAYYNGRLRYGGNKAQPNTVWSSQVGDVGQMAPESLFDGVAANSAEAFNSTISTEKSSRIKWMIPQKQLLIGASSGEFFAEDSIGASTTTLAVQSQTNYGSVERQPVIANNNAVFVDRSEATLREFAFNFQDDNYRADNLSFFSDHLPHLAGWDKETPFLYGSINEVTIQKAPDVIVWCVNNKGGLFGITRDRTNGVAAWHEHVLGGLGESSIVKPKVQSIAVMRFYSKQELEQTGNIEAPLLDKECLFVLVKRQFGSESPRVYVERVNRQYWNPRMFIPEDNDFKASAPVAAHMQGNIDMIYVDCAIEVDGSGSVSSTISLPSNAGYGGGPRLTGAAASSHLVGQEVSVVADGRYLGDFTATGGSIDLSAHVSDFEYAIVGYRYETEIVTLPIDAGSLLETAQGDLKRIEEVIFKFWQSLGASIATVSDELVSATPDGGSSPAYIWKTVERESRDINFGAANLPVGAELPLFSGTQKIAAPGGHSRDAKIMVKNSSVFPMYISYMVMRGLTHER